jgi:hypothetical protein
VPVMMSRPKAPRRRHVVVLGLAPGVWHPELVGKVRNYAETPEAYAVQCQRLAANVAKAREAGLLTRQGVPNGYRGMKPEVEAIRRNSQEEGERLAAVLLPPDDGLRGNLAVAFALSVVVNPSCPIPLRLRAARIVLPFLRARSRAGPESASGLLDFLETLVASLSRARVTAQ